MDEPESQTAIPLEVYFTPTVEAKAAFKRMSDDASDEMMKQFFEIWKAENDPRRAGSMAAHAYIKNAARMAVFGAHCAGREPQHDLWLAVCMEAYSGALRDVSAAFVQTVLNNDAPDALRE